MWLRLIVEVVILALVSVSLVSFLRAFGPIARLVKAGKKPWSCDVCLSFWTMFAAMIVGCLVDRVTSGTWQGLKEFAIVFLPSHGLALVILAKTRVPDFSSIFSEPTGTAPTQDGGSWTVGGASKGDRP